MFQDVSDYESYMMAIGQMDIPDEPDEKKVRQLRQGILSQSEQNATIKKAYNDALYQFYKTMFLRDMVSNVAERGVFPIKSDLTMIRDVHERTTDRLSSKPPYMLITVNVKTDISLRMLMKKVEKFISKKTITSYAYCYEVRNSEGGLHCHLLVHYTPKPYDFKRSTKNTFKTLCDVNNPSCLNFKFVEEENLLSKYKYINGEKSDKKNASVLASAKYREENKLAKIYESSPPLPCRATLIEAPEPRDVSTTPPSPPPEGVVVSSEARQSSHLK